MLSHAATLLLGRRLAVYRDDQGWIKRRRYGAFFNFLFVFRFRASLEDTGGFRLPRGAGHGMRDATP